MRIYRGRLPLGWTVSPALLELAPSILQYLYRNASNTAQGNDFFIAAPSGVGYTYPDYYESSQMHEFAALTAAFMKEADMRILNVIGK